jgi:hypothetical protein
MKLQLLLVSSLLATLAALSACGHDADSKPVDAADSSAQPGDSSLETQAKHAVSNAENATKDAVHKAQEQWNKLTNTKMSDLDQSFSALKEKAAEASGEAKVELDKLVRELDEQRKALQQQFAELEASSSEKWQAAKQRIDENLTQLKKSIDSALEKSK